MASFDAGTSESRRRPRLLLRRAQEWPPTVACQEGWGRAYAELASGLPVRGSVEEAVEWANELIGAIDGADGAAR